jgi:hypothetical protein
MHFMPTMTWQVKGQSLVVAQQHVHVQTTTAGIITLSPHTAPKLAPT